MPNLPPPTSKKLEPPGFEFLRIEEGQGPSKTVLYTVEGWGKTTAMAYAPKPLVIMSPQETGFVTLRRAGRVPDVPSYRVTSWSELMKLLRTADLSQFETICLDALGGLGQMAKDFVLSSEFGGDIKKYASYGKGDSIVDTMWMELLGELETISHGRNIILAGHARTVSAKDPSNDDYNRWVCDVVGKTWEPTKRWADNVLFGRYFTVVDDGKGKGGTERVVYTEHRDTHDAKNRYALPYMIKVPNKPESVYSSIFTF